MEHQLKISQDYLIHILEGRKTFEIRYNDRDFQVGDTIQFLPLQSEEYNVYAKYSSIPYFDITYIHANAGDCFLKQGYVIIGIKPLFHSKGD
jgi:hypothetical protein